MLFPTPCPVKPWMGAFQVGFGSPLPLSLLLTPHSEPPWSAEGAWQKGVAAHSTQPAHPQCISRFSLPKQLQVPSPTISKRFFKNVDSLVPRTSPAGLMEPVLILGRSLFCGRGVWSKGLFIRQKGISSPNQSSSVLRSR